MTSLAEHRAELEDADLDYEPVPVEHALAHCRAYLAHLDREHHVEPHHTHTICHDCHLDVRVAWQYGTKIVCRRCRRHRLRAARQLDRDPAAGETTFATIMYALADKAADTIRKDQA